jgi:hypothetical protein
LVNRNNFQCWNCQGYGHVARFCRQPKRTYCTRYKQNSDLNRSGLK